MLVIEQEERPLCHLKVVARHTPAESLKQPFLHGSELVDMRDLENLLELVKEEHLL